MEFLNCNNITIDNVNVYAQDGYCYLKRYSFIEDKDKQISLQEYRDLRKQEVEFYASHKDEIDNLYQEFKSFAPYLQIAQTVDRKEKQARKYLNESLRFIELANANDVDGFLDYLVSLHHFYDHELNSNVMSGAVVDEVVERFCEWPAKGDRPCLAVAMRGLNNQLIDPKEYADVIFKGYESLPLYKISYIEVLKRTIALINKYYKVNSDEKRPSDLTPEFIEDALSQYIDERKPFDVMVPAMYKEKIINAIELELVNSDSKFYQYLNGRTAKTNKESLTQKCMYLVAWMYATIYPKYRLGKRVCCSDFSFKQLSQVFGDCSKNNTVVGWQSIREFLISKEIIVCNDPRMIHDSNTLKSMCYGYTLFGFEDYDERPTAYVDEDGVCFTNNPNFTYNDLELVPYRIDDYKFLKTLALRKVRYYNPATVVGMEALCMTKLRISNEDYKTITEQELPKLKKAKEELTNESEKDELSAKIFSTTKTIEAIHNMDFKSLNIKQSNHTNRIFNGITTMKREIRKYLKLDGYKGKLMQVDAKSSQLSLLAMMYSEDMQINKIHDTTLKTIMDNDIYKSALAFFKVHGYQIFTRQAAKVEVFHSIFTNKYGTEGLPFSEYLKEYFNLFYKWLLRNKGKGKTSALAVRSQRCESDIFVGRYKEYWSTSKSALAELYRNGVWAISIHDSIVVKEEDIPAVKAALKRAYRSKFPNVNMDGKMFDSMLKVKDLGE